MDNRKHLTLGLIAVIGSILTIASLNVQVSAWQQHTTLNGYIIYALAIVPDIGFVVLAFFDYQIRTSGRTYNGIKFGVGVFIVVSLILNISGSTTTAEAFLFGSFPVIIAMITHIGIGSLKVLNDGVSDFQLEVERKTKELTGFVVLMRDMMQQFEVVGDANTDLTNELIEQKFNQVIDAIPQPQPVDLSAIEAQIEELAKGLQTNKPVVVSTIVDPKKLRTAEARKNFIEAYPWAGAKELAEIWGVSERHITTKYLNGAGK